MERLPLARGKRREHNQTESLNQTTTSESGWRQLAMGTDSGPHPVEAVIDLKTLDELIHALEQRGYEVLGPAIRDAAIDWQPIAGIDDLPGGWTANQSPGRYRLERRNDAKRFGFAAG